MPLLHAALLDANPDVGYKCYQAGENIASSSQIGGGLKPALHDYMTWDGRTWRLSEWTTSSSSLTTLRP